jgi:DNA-binding transcriptional LysR family regulator
MNRRSLVPSISLLEAFEASARHCSFTQAAQELHLTQSAVSRQVQALEDSLGIPLFTRYGRKITLTEIGAGYAREIAAALMQIRSASSQVIAFKTGVGSLQLAILPTFASKWLLPRLSDFYAHHPGVLVHIHSRIGAFNLLQSGIDAFITAGDQSWPGMVVHQLLEDERVVIASPNLLNKLPLKRPEDLYQHTLLGVSTRPHSWMDWFRTQNLSPRQMQMGTLFEFTAHLIQAVVAGMGVGVVTRVLIEDELKSGTLVIPFEQSFVGRHSYCLVYPMEKERYPPLVAFRQWVLNETQRSRN